MLRVKHISEEGNDLNIVRELFREYEKELDEDICFQSFEAELKQPLDKYGDPAGDLLLAWWNDDPAGCIALTGTKDKKTCEMKRLYVKPAFRKNGIGNTLVESLIASATEKGYSVIRLDTFSKLQPAIKLYEQYGFKYIGAYYPNPLPGVIYMEKELGSRI